MLFVFLFFYSLNFVFGRGAFTVAKTPQKIIAYYNLMEDNCHKDDVYKSHRSHVRQTTKKSATNHKISKFITS